MTLPGTFESGHLLSTFPMHIINPIWLHEKEITSLNDAILELTNSVLNPYSLVSRHTGDFSWGPWESLFKDWGGGSGDGGAGIERLAKTKHN